MIGRKKLRSSVLFEPRGATLILSLCFLLGSLIGCLCSKHIVNHDELGYYIEHYISSAVGENVTYRFLPIVFDTIRIPFLVFLMGFTFLGPVGIPCIFVLRGFGFCLSVSSFAAVFGLSGVFFAFFLLGISALIWAPPFFLLGCQGMKCSYHVVCRSFGERRVTQCPERAFLLESLFCFLLIVLSALVEFWLIPLLLPVVGRAL